MYVCMYVFIHINFLYINPCAIDYNYVVVFIIIIIITILIITVIFNLSTLLYYLYT